MGTKDEESRPAEPQKPTRRDSDVKTDEIDIQEREKYGRMRTRKC